MVSSRISHEQKQRINEQSLLISELDSVWIVNVRVPMVHATEVREEDQASSRAYLNSGI